MWRSPIVLQWSLLSGKHSLKNFPMTSYPELMPGVIKGYARPENIYNDSIKIMSLKSLWTMKTFSV
jgi:hypothetical protein